MSHYIICITIYVSLCMYFAIYVCQCVPMSVCVCLQSSMLQSIERYMKQAIVDKDASVSSAALASSLVCRLFINPLTFPTVAFETMHKIIICLFTFSARFFCLSAA